MKTAMKPLQKQKSRRRISLSCALFLSFALLLSGCGKKNTDNIEEAMNSIKELNYDAALESLDKAESLGENIRLVERGRGIAYMGKTMYEEAIECFIASLSYSDGSLEKMDYDINYYLGTCYFKLGRYEEAIEVFDSILALKKEECDAYYLRGVVKACAGRIDDACADFDMALSLRKDDYDMLIRIFDVLNEQGYRNLGQDYLQAAMDGGTKKMTNFEKGRISFYLEDYENARLYLEKARDENGSAAVLFLGMTYETLGDNNYAVSVYNTYLSSGAEDPEVYNHLGLCLMKMGSYEDALNAFQTAMNIEEGNTIMQSLKMNEIIAYEYLGQFKKAAVLMESYLKTYPDDAEAQREYIFLKSR